MKYIIGSLIISFGILFVALILLRSLHVQIEGNMMQYLGIAWLVLTIAVYPFAKKWIRD